MAWRPRSWVNLIGAVATGCLVVLAVRADLDAAGASVSAAVIDVVVGVAIIAGAAVARGPSLSRALFAGVGAAWLIGSFVDDAVLVHQAVLIAALVTFPTGRPRGVVRWALIGFAVPVALTLVPQPWVAVAFTVVAATRLASWRTDPPAAGSAALAAAGIAGLLTISWLSTRADLGIDAALLLRAYELVLSAVALGHPIAAWVVSVRRRRLTDRVLDDTGLTGLVGLTAVLRDVVGDPTVTIHAGSPTIRAPDREWLDVEDGDRKIATVEHRLGVLDDRATAAALAAAVGLTVVHQQRQQHLADRLDELRAARARLVEAADRQRRVTATRLEADVVVPLQRATAELRKVAASVPSGEAADAVGVVLRELSTAAGEIVDLVGGVAPAQLGGGRLGEAIKGLADRSPLTVTVSATPAAAGDSGTEAALFYVCSEALTNAVKHSDATRVLITVDGEGDALRLTVSDDGCGGADATGSGLQGLADRLAALGGRLSVDSPAGAGTTVTATIPR